MEHLNIPPANHVKVLGGQGWVGLIDHLGSESTIVNAARVSFGKLKNTMDDRDVKLLEYLIDNRHTSPLEHVVFTFSIHCPLFVRGQWHRHRTWSYNEISRRYTEIDMEFYTPEHLRRQSENNRQASFDDPDFADGELRQQIAAHNQLSLELYDRLLASGVCREQARGVLPQNMMVTFWGTVDLANLLHFLQLRDSSHAQYEIREYAVAIRQLIRPIVPHVMDYYEKNLAENAPGK
ncbi:MAG: FAD-dependent thymidylate synthase [Lentisphaeria bacterium]|nr:FAD-dependent thymidylate synthase [Lentisphaeria bacterium]